MLLSIFNTNSPLNNSTPQSSDIHHKTNSLYNKKAVLLRQLDKRLVPVFKHCKKDTSSPICSILWNDVFEILTEIDDINNKTNLHQLYDDNVLFD